MGGDSVVTHRGRQRPEVKALDLPRIYQHRCKQRGATGNNGEDETAPELGKRP